MSVLRGLDFGRPWRASPERFLVFGQTALLAIPLSFVLLSPSPGLSRRLSEMSRLSLLRVSAALSCHVLHTAIDPSAYHPALFQNCNVRIGVLGQLQTLQLTLPPSVSEY